MIKQSTKELPCPNKVYDPYNQKVWDLEKFFETLALYYEGKPQLMAEDIINAIHTLTSMEYNESTKTEFQDSFANLFNP